MVLIKNRAAGSLEPRLVGPFTFIQYKDRDKYVSILETAEGKQFDCSTSQVVLCGNQDYQKEERVLHVFYV